MKRIFIYLILTLSAVSALAQNVNVTGVVSDALTSETLPGVSVTVKGTFNGTITDFDGNYSISVPENAVLEFSSIGYESFSTAVSGRTVIDCALNPSQEFLDEVVVTAMGISKKRKSLGYSVTEVDGDEMIKAR